MAIVSGEIMNAEEEAMLMKKMFTRQRRAGLVLVEPKQSNSKKGRKSKGGTGTVSKEDKSPAQTKKSKTHSRGSPQRSSLNSKDMKGLKIKVETSKMFEMKKLNKSKSKKKSVVDQKINLNLKEK